MDIKKIALLVGALLVAGVSAFFAKNFFDGTSAPAANASAMPAQPNGPQILVATRSLPVGTILGPDAFKLQPWPKDLIENAYFKQGGYDAGKMNGMVVRNAISAGQPLTQGALVSPGDRGFLAAALSPGMRAITIRTSDLSGVAGFVFPGDRVDLIMTQTLGAKVANESSLKVAETVLRNLRVLATDKRTETKMKDGKPDVESYSMVTLEATPRMAEKALVAQNVGDLTLSLRSIAESGTELEAAIAGGATTIVDPKNPNAKKVAAPVVAPQRPVDAGPTYSTGGDVSRFQRRSIPSVPNPKKDLDAIRALAGAIAGSRNNQGRSPTSNTYKPAPVQKGPVVKIHRPGGTTEVEVGGN